MLWGKLAWLWLAWLGWPVGPWGGRPVCGCDWEPRGLVRAALKGWPGGGGGVPELPEEAELRRGLRFRPKKERVMPARPPSPLVTDPVSVARVEERVERAPVPGWLPAGAVLVVFMCDGVRLREVRDDMTVRSR